MLKDQAYDQIYQQRLRSRYRKGKRTKRVKQTRFAGWLAAPTKGRTNSRSERYNQATDYS